MEEGANHETKPRPHATHATQRNATRKTSPSSFVKPTRQSSTFTHTQYRPKEVTCTNCKSTKVPSANTTISHCINYQLLS